MSGDYYWDLADAAWRLGPRAEIAARVPAQMSPETSPEAEPPTAVASSGERDVRSR